MLIVWGLFSLMMESDLELEAKEWVERFTAIIIILICYCKHMHQNGWTVILTKLDLFRCLNTYSKML